MCVAVHRDLSVSDLARRQTDIKTAAILLN